MQRESVQVVTVNHESSWRCRECGERQRDEPGVQQFCRSCGRPRIDVDWIRRFKRFGLIFFGLAIQILTGAMIFLIPPGTYAWAWVIYLAMGIIGFLHIFIGVELSRKDQVDRAQSEQTAERRWLPVGTGGWGSPELELPVHARRCPDCHHSLIDVLDRGQRRCPGCRRRFSLRDLGLGLDDPAGELISVSPHEARLGGGALVAGLLALAIVAALVLTTLLAAGSSGGAPGP